MINLVTGGAGLIGSHLIDKLLSRDEKVICLDNFHTGSNLNLERFEKKNNYKFIEHNIIDPFNLNVDRIWHLASPASPLKYQKDPILTSKIIIFGSFNVLEIARKNKAQILFASTSEIYGDPKINPQKENYFGYVNPISKRSCYVEGKRFSESLFFDYLRTYNLDIKIARIFNTYGPGMLRDDGRVISNLINQGLINQKLTIFGSGKQKRCFCYVEDMVDGIIKLMDSTYKGVINLGNPKEELEIHELGKLIISKINHKLEIIKLMQREDEPQIRKPDISLAKDLLKWSPKVDINQGLDKTIDYFIKFIK